MGGLNYSVDSVLNLPLSDIGAVRVVGYKIGDAGFLENGFSGAEDVGYEHTNGGRAAILLKPTDQLDITLSGIFQDSGFGEYYQATDHYPALIIDEAEPEPFQDEYRLGALKINYDFGSVKLTSVTSYYDRRRFFLNDIDYFTGFIGVPRAYSPLTYTARTVSQEFRLASTGTGPLGWLVGAYFEDDHEQALQSVSPAGAPVPPPAEQLVDINRVTNYRQYALFGEANYAITPKLTATAGVRVSRIRGDNTSINDGLLYGGESIKTGNNDNNPVTPRVILSYMPTRDWQIYALASKGFRIGGVNPGLPPCLPQNGCTVDVKSTFNPDTVWNYRELLGTKSAMCSTDGISFDADVFGIDWSNIQLSVDRGDGFNGFMNIGKATVKGVELSVRAAITEHWHTGGQFTYTDGKITELGPGIAATGTVAVGDAVPAVPRVSTSGFLEWGTHVAGGGWLDVRGDVSYITTRYGDFAAEQPIPLLPYSIGNLRVGLDEGPNSVSVFVNNVTDRRAMLAVQNYSGVHDGEPYSWLRYNINIPTHRGHRVHAPLLRGAALVRWRLHEIFFAHRIRERLDSGDGIPVTRRRYTELARSGVHGLASSPGTPGGRCNHDVLARAGHRHYRECTQDRDAEWGRGDAGDTDRRHQAVDHGARTRSRESHPVDDPRRSRLAGNADELVVPGWLGGLLHGGAVGPARLRQDLQRERSSSDPADALAQTDHRGRGRSSAVPALAIR